MKGVAEKRREGIWAAENLWVVLVRCTVVQVCSNASSVCVLKGVLFIYWGQMCAIATARKKMIFSLKYIVYLGSLKL